MELLVAALLLGFSSLALTALAVHNLRAREVAIARLLRRAPAGSQAAQSSVNPLPEQLGRWLAPLSGALNAESYGPLRVQLVEAGYRSPSALAIYMGTRIALAITLAAAALPSVALVLPPVWWPVAELSAAAAGFIAPGIFVGIRRSRRQRAIFRALPDAIDLMVVCVEAGLSLGATLHRVATEFRVSSPVIAAELALVVLETQAGKSLTAALRGLGERSGVSDLHSLVSALVQTERLGTRIADTMRVQSEAVRTKRLRMAEELAQKAPVKMLFPAVLIFSAMLIAAIVPAALEMMAAFSR
jgi:tight adherence protein C